MPHDNNNRFDIRGSRPAAPADAERRTHKIEAAGKAFRALTAIVVFGIPLVTGTATLVGYGIYRAYRRMTGRP